MLFRIKCSKCTFIGNVSKWGLLGYRSNTFARILGNYIVQFMIVQGMQGFFKIFLWYLKPILQAFMQLAQVQWLDFITDWSMLQDKLQKKICCTTYFQRQLMYYELLVKMMQNCSDFDFSKL
eukprot:TRINITY_DN87841_c0_g1_i1.p2 TRINITY_DN87841_c0_g1~~TRINITY_DN87841_c0_g1_i1.p2  ORF type:complete len:122 (-),score=0.10 TRINITY_DN87841_c0_g1_i1:14-379(-)